MATLLQSPFSYFVDVNGLPLSGGKVYTYSAGTTAPKDTYTDSTGTIAASNPIILDSTGIASIWITGAYNIQVYNSADVLQPHLSSDNVTSSVATGDMTKAVYDPANIQEQLVGLTAVQTLTNKTLGTETIAVTQAIRDNTTKIATTAYVQGEKYLYQNASVITSSLATGTTTIPLDDTIPQNTEGDEYMTLAFTPISASNTLVIEATVILGSGGGGHAIAALFKDSDANALAAGAQISGGGGTAATVKITHTMTAGTTSAITFRIRGGHSVAGTTSFNGISGARIFGGVASSSIVIREVR